MAEMVSWNGFFSGMMTVVDHRPPGFSDDELLTACRSCGACCAGFRVMLNWTEIDDFAPGGVPAAMTEKFGEYVAAMRAGPPPEHRCVALEGTIGVAVRCTIYEQRGSACREFSPLTDEGKRNLNCDAARKAFSLPPLVLPAWVPPPTPTGHKKGDALPVDPLAEPDHGTHSA